MGAVIQELDDGLIVTPSKLHGADLFSHHDHRIAMSLAVASLMAAGDLLYPRDRMCQ
jgi:3-phosphoshikimate 1-carboxyvinyltransferase